ncbi:MAG: hypothetical protein H7Y07_02890 [Pyrinomonadaceae bacterium]|nr:hypothetical protein [Sphingobacteriaceae bacterium]
MSEGLENYIRNHRKELDEAEPPEALWNRIEKGLDDHKKAAKAATLRKQLNVVFKIAALFTIVLTAGIFFITYQKNKPVNVIAISPELAQQQVHYTAMIETRISELQQIKTLEPQLYREFSFELHKLDVTYRRLKNDLDTSPNQEKTLKAMVTNLQIQAQILNQQLSIIQQIKQLKTKQQHENQAI